METKQILEYKFKDYEARLDLIRTLCLTNQIALIEKNKDKIRETLEGYNQFKDHPQYDRVLAKFPEFYIGGIK